MVERFGYAINGECQEGCAKVMYVYLFFILFYFKVYILYAFPLFGVLGLVFVCICGGFFAGMNGA